MSGNYDCQNSYFLICQISAIEKKIIITVLEYYMNKNDVTLIIITGILLAIILIISFYYNDSYIQSLSIASLPIGIGVITTKLLTDRWQIKNEKSKIKRGVLEDFQVVVASFF